MRDCDPGRRLPGSPAQGRDPGETSPTVPHRRGTVNGMLPAATLDATSPTSPSSATSSAVLLLVVVVVAAAAACAVALAVLRGGRRHVGEREPAAAGVDPHLDALRGELRADLHRLHDVVAGLGERTAQQFGRMDSSLRLHAEATSVLSDAAQGLREALANPKARGQWGERMAEDVLRRAGFVEHVNYRKQTAVRGDGRGIPDFTFFMPKGHVLYMDVKFPITSYLRACEAHDDAEAAAHRERFLRDVRLRVRELARREYQASTDGPVLEQVLLFLPNETISTYIFEHDPSLLDDALQQRVVLCTPITLFAYLGLIRQAFDSFMVESTSDRVLSLLGRFDEQWSKYCDSLDAVRRRFDAVQKELDTLTGTRRRGLERPLREIEALRRERGLPIAERSFGRDDELPMVAPPA